MCAVDERDAAERFDQEIVRLIPGTPDPAEEPSVDFRERVHVARSLATLDLPNESRVRESLRDQLTQALARRNASGATQVRRRLWVIRRPVLATSLGIAVAMALLAMVAPRSLAAFAGRMLDSLLRVGDHTAIVRFAPQTAEEIAAIVREFQHTVANGQSWFVSTDYGGFGGAVPQGEGPSVRRVASFPELTLLTTLRHPRPTLQHRGGLVQFDHALVAPGGPVLLFYGSGRNELFLALFPVTEGRTVSFSRSVATTTPDGGLVSRGSPPLRAEELSLDGRRAVWDPENTGLNSDLSALRWEADGTSYSLMGRSLTREEAISLFLSMQPVDPPE